MAKYSFSTVGASKVDMINIISIINKKDNTMAARYAIKTPLDDVELHRLISNWTDDHTNSINNDLLVCTEPCFNPEDAKNLPKIGLSGLAYICSGEGVIKEKMNIYFKGKSYEVDPDKFEAFIKSLE